MDLPGKDEKTMSDVNTLLTSIRDAIAGDAATKVWTQATYTKDHTLFVGVDINTPPAEADCPCVVLAPVEKVGGEEQDTIGHQFNVSCEIFDESMTTVTSTTTYKDSILALITAELTREGKTAGEIATAIALITDSFDDDPTATIDSNITEYAGVKRIETFRQKVLAAVASVADIKITKVETAYEAIAFFPAFMCDMLITIEQETEFGDDFVQ